MSSTISDSSVDGTNEGFAAPLKIALGQLGRSLLQSLGTTRGLVVMYAAAAVLRLLIAPHVAFYPDMLAFWNFTAQVHEGGFDRFITANSSGAVVWYGVFSALTGLIAPRPSLLLIKTPTFICDLLVAWVTSRLAAERYELNDPRRSRAMVIVSSAILFGPAVLGVGAVWGQIEAAPVLFAVLGSLLLVGGTRSVVRDAGALAAFAAAFAIKPQTTFFAPVVLYVLVRRYVLDSRDRRSQLVGGTKVVGLTAIGLGVLVVSGLPFGFGLRDQMTGLRKAAGSTATSGNAFNFWGIFGFWRGDSGAASIHTPLNFLGIQPRFLGLILFVIGCAVVLRQLHRSLAAGANLVTAYLWAASATSMVAFTFLTRMHERYFFYSLVLFTPLVSIARLRRLYLVMSVYFVANLWYAFTYYNVGTRESNPGLGVRDLRFEPWYGWMFGDIYVIPTPMKRFWSVMGVVICLVVVAGGKRWLVEAPDQRPSVPQRLWQWWRRNLFATVHDEPSDATVSRKQGLWVLGGVFAVVVWWLGSLRDQLRAARTLNDSTFHMQMVRWAEEQLRDGRIPFDGWFPDLTLGSAFFHYYQSLPYNLTALFSRVMPGDSDQTFRWSLYILLATWPLIIYASARLFQLSRVTAMIAASVALLLVSVTGYGFEIGSYTFGGYGVYTQLFGMWMLPLAWAATWRALHQNRSLALAAIAVAFTVATHFMTGYLALVSVAAIALAAPSRTVLMRGGAVLVGAPLVASWVLVPLLRDRHYSTVSEFYIGTIFNDSYGAGPIVRWLVSGSLLDEGRLPIITLLAAIGVAACAVQWRVNARGRALLLLAAASLALFFGRATWGSLTNLLPGDDNLQMHRFVAGVHLSAIFLAAIGGNVVLRTVVAAAHKVANAVAKNRGEQVNSTAWLSPTVAVAVLGLLLTPALIERTNYSLRDGDYIDAQQAQDAADGADVNALLDVVAERNDGRVYAGTRANWGKDYLIGSVPVLQMLAHRDLDSLGYTFRTMPSLSNDIEAYIDETNLAQLEMFNVRYLVLPADREPQVSATLLSSRGRHRLYEVTTSGYLDVVDRVGSIAADRSNLAARTGEFRTSQNALAGVYPGIAFDGRDASANTFDGTPPQQPGTVVSQSHQRRSGAFTAKVSLQRPGVVLAKTTYDPGWRAFVDGVERPTTFMAPAFVGVDVGIGTHDVRFEYQPYSKYPLWWALGVATLAALSWLHRRLATKVRSWTTN